MLQPYNKSIADPYEETFNSVLNYPQNVRSLKKNVLPVYRASFGGGLRLCVEFVTFGNLSPL